MNGFLGSCNGFINSSGSGGGGGGSVTTDNLTVLGDGSSNPLIATGSLTQEIINSSSLYNLDFNGNTRPRLLIVVADNVDIQFGSGIYSNTFLRVINRCPSNRINVITSGGINVYFDGTDIPVTYIPLGTTYDFVFDLSTGFWYCVNHFPNPTQNLDNTVSIGLTYPGFYKIMDTGALGSIILNFPSPTVCAGQRLITWIFTTFDVLVGINAPIDASGTPLASLSANKIYEFICLDDEWIRLQSIQ